MPINTGDKLRQLGPEERLGQYRESEYLGAEDIAPGAEPVLTIEGIWYGEVTLQRGREKKDVMSFVEKAVPGINNVRPLIVNATNRRTLKKLFGSVQAKTLTGKKIQLYIDHRVRDPQDGSLTDGVRIRPFAPREAALLCEGCGGRIEPQSGMTSEQIAARTKRRYGRTLCAACATKEAAKVAQTAKKAEAKEKDEAKEKAETAAAPSSSLPPAAVMQGGAEAPAAALAAGAAGESVTQNEADEV